MKENRKTKLILCISLTAVFSGVIAVVVAVCMTAFGGNAPSVALPGDTSFVSDTEEVLDSESETVDIDTVIDSETEEISVSGPAKAEEMQVQLDECLLDIVLWLEESIPYYTMPEETDEEGNVTEPSFSYQPKVSFFYKDLSSGVSMAYNEDEVLYTASIIKEAYILWALREIEKAESEGNAQGNKYDVNNVFVYTEDKYKSGSGIIQKAEYGNTYTYLDLLRLSITESDNIAFAEIRNVYGRAGFNEFSESIGALSPKKSMYSASAKEMSFYLEETYRFFESGTEYAEMLKSWMLSTNHRIMIPSALGPTPVANKYGWDIGAYHDMAIVFSENPYILVIMTELDRGSNADNRFIRELVGKINDAHIAIYGDLE